MCCECHMSRCPAGCPNAPDPPQVYRCEHCREAIRQGEYYAEINESRYHEECFADCAEDILLEKFGATKGVAEVSGSD